jgi:hypothetical protein
MKKPKPSVRDNDSQNTLLGDLESIRSLLDMSPAPAVAEDESRDVPMLEDMVDGAFTVNESLLTSRASIDDSGDAMHRSGAGGKSGLADDTIKALLGDEWRSAARQILADARATVEGAGGSWSEQHTRVLNDTLKLRIDHTVDDWLTEMMHARIEDLRSQLLAVLQREIEAFTRRRTDGQ